MNGLTSKADVLEVFEAFVGKFRQQWPNYFPAYLDNFPPTESCGIGIKLRAGRALCRLIRNRRADGSFDQVVALLLLLVQLIQDDPEGIASLGRRLIPKDSGAFGKVLRDFCQEWPHLSLLPNAVKEASSRKSGNRVRPDRSAAHLCG